MTTTCNSISFLSEDFKIEWNKYCMISLEFRRLFKTILKTNPVVDISGQHALDLLKESFEQAILLPQYSWIKNCTYSFSSSEVVNSIKSAMITITMDNPCNGNTDITQEILYTMGYSYVNTAILNFLKNQKIANTILLNSDEEMKNVYMAFISATNQLNSVSSVYTMYMYQFNQDGSLPGDTDKYIMAIEV